MSHVCPVMYVASLLIDKRGDLVIFDRMGSKEESTQYLLILVDVSNVKRCKRLWFARYVLGTLCMLDYVKISTVNGPHHQGIHVMQNPL